MDNLYIKEKKLELDLEKLVNQLISDLNQIEESNKIDKSNYEYMEEVYNYLSRAEYFIVAALTYSKGFKIKSLIKSDESIKDFLNKFKK